MQILSKTSLAAALCAAFALTSAALPVQAAESTPAQQQTQGQLTTWPQFLRRLGISFGIGLLLALIVCQLLKMKMRSVYRQAEASAYVTAEGLQLTRREDVFTHTTTARRKIERKSDSSSSSDSSSFSGGGGHGRSGSF